MANVLPQMDALVTFFSSQPRYEDELRVACMGMNGVCGSKSVASVLKVLECWHKLLAAMETKPVDFKTVQTRLNELLQQCSKRSVTKAFKHARMLEQRKELVLRLELAQAVCECVEGSPCALTHKLSQPSYQRALQSAPEFEQVLQSCVQCCHQRASSDVLSLLELLETLQSILDGDAWDRIKRTIPISLLQRLSAIEREAQQKIYDAIDAVQAKMALPSTAAAAAAGGERDPSVLAVEQPAAQTLSAIPIAALGAALPVPSTPIATVNKADEDAKADQDANCQVLLTMERLAMSGMFW